MLSELKNRAKDAEDYGKFWDNFGSVLKEGVWEDAEHRAEIAPLLRFRSSTQEGWTSLPDYLSRMQEGQDTIWYLAGDNPDALRALAAARRLPREGHRGAAAGRFDRRVLAGAAG